MAKRAATATVSRGRAQEPAAQEAPSGLPYIETTVVGRRGDKVVATERFGVPLLVRGQDARLWADTFSRKYLTAVRNVVRALK